YFQGTKFSDLQFPANSGLKEKILECGSTGNAIPPVLMIEVVASYKLEDFETKENHTCFYATTKYSLITNNSVTVEDLYPFYKESMEIMTKGLNELEKKNSLPQTEDLHPLSIEKLRPHLQKIVDAYYSA
ncbi:MAG TPA: hypothetical protein VFI06_14065, partial [Chitinophagaceae bacterium]|nr:hypothetical protein [Chitinophagaceae bacterium]